eukprot:14343589-Alexandrium_andersonii.AAC.1
MACPKLPYAERGSDDDFPVFAPTTCHKCAMDTWSRGPWDGCVNPLCELGPKHYPCPPPPIWPSDLCPPRPQ